MSWVATCVHTDEVHCPTLGFVGPQFSAYTCPVAAGTYTKTICSQSI